MLLQWRTLLTWRIRLVRKIVRASRTHKSQLWQWKILGYLLGIGVPKCFQTQKWTRSVYLNICFILNWQFICTQLHVGSLSTCCRPNPFIELISTTCHFPLLRFIFSLVPHVCIKFGKYLLIQCISTSMKWWLGQTSKWISFGCVVLSSLSFLSLVYFRLNKKNIPFKSKLTLRIVQCNSLLQ